MSDHSTSVDRIRKLIAHEESARSIGNLEEAQAFASRITELMQKHGLEMSDVERAEEEDQSPVGRTYVNPGSKTGKARSSRSAWREKLGMAVAASMFCRMHIIPGKSTLVFVGREQQRIAAVMLFNFLHEQCNQLCKVAYRDYSRKLSLPMSQSDFRHSFTQGFAQAIYDRLMGDMVKLKGDTEKGLVLVRRHETAIDQFLKGTGFRGKSAQGLARSINYNSYAEGYTRGSQVPTSQRKTLGDGK